VTSVDRIPKGDVCFGSKADIEGLALHVRFAPESGHRMTREAAKPHAGNYGFLAALRPLIHRPIRLMLNFDLENLDFAPVVSRLARVE